MRALGWNCQGIGKSLGSSTMTHLARMAESTKAQVIFVSEIKSSKFSSADIVSRFSMDDSVIVPSRGRSGGLWLMWNHEVYVSVLSSSFYLIIANVTIRATNQQFGLICIYGDPYHRQTSTIWEQIANFVHDNYNLPLLCMGDMNELLYDMDKSTPLTNRSRVNAFHAMIKNCGFFDLGFSGPVYTWTNRRFSSKPIFERLDRCLANADWCASFPVTNVYNMPLIHTISDHAPILLSTDGPIRRIKKTFKFENWWLKEEDFQHYALNQWSKTTRRPFSQRTKNLARGLKVWCRKKKPLQQELNDLEEQIHQLQMQPTHQQNLSLQNTLVTRYEQNLTKITDFYMQRAKKQWIKDGDRNTSFFYRAIQKRRRRNTIVSIKDENNVVHYMPMEISNTFVNYFRHIFASSNVNVGRPYTASQLPSNSDDYTYSVPDKQELWEMLQEMKKNASPGPDGFNVEFYLATWSWIGDDVVSLVRAFFHSGLMPSHINDTHIVLIPKKLVPMMPADYRPISLCNVVYKLIAKSLANRLKSHLPDYIHPSQQAFIQGRRISNNIIIAQEITHSFALTSWKHQSFMLKIDLSKAFDRLEWNFIVEALARAGLHGHFINLIHACISSPTFSVVINGQPFARFRSNRGIRQGCPLSPYLFVLATNELSLALQEAMAHSSLEGVTLGPNCPPIHSLLFADDLLICGTASIQEANTMKQILDSFCLRSGQTPNWAKSGIIFSKHVQTSNINAVKSIFQVQNIDESFVHLGHPLILPAKNRASAYNFVIDKFKSKLSTYKADKLSHAARLQLIQSVFSSIPVYYMSNILFSKKFIAKLTAIIRTFWWTGVREETTHSLCLRAWRDICAPKKEGGLGIRNLQAVNQSLILMSAWRIAQNPNDHLHQVLRSKYFPESSIWRPKPNIPKSAFWASVLKILHILKAHSFYQLTQGNISIWNAPWCAAWTSVYDDLIIQPPNFVYPALVKDLWIPNRRKWNEQLIDSIFRPATAHIIKDTPIIDSDEPDFLCWKLTDNGTCHAKSAYFACVQDLYDTGEDKPRQPAQPTKNLLHQVWNNKNLLPRIQTFAWRFLRKALPTGARAGRFSKHISKTCCRCGLEEDDLHLFFTCPFAKAAWFLQPWFIRTDMIIQNCTSLTQIIQSLLNMNHPHASLSNILTFMWCLWKSRNDTLFNRKKGEPYQISINAKALTANHEMFQVGDQSLQDTTKQHKSASSEGQAQGSTIPTDRFISGTVIFIDASWKCRNIPDASGLHATGIGVFIKTETNGRSCSVMIQAASRRMASVFQAEASSLLLAANLAQLLQIQNPTFLTDNQVLAKVAASRNLKHPQLRWDSRDTMASFLQATSKSPVQIFHIKRDLNGIAHDCAKQVLRRDQDGPIFGCNNSAHSADSCPIVLALQSAVIQDIVLTAVLCC